ncbi:dihydrolipoamide acetyltransferase family protein [Galbitalea soli]|uniref:Dihydrolipoamide acetyltransferase component of pyruvate dehydrogenase complex n=1 Tax=Galbitalea soli TaxID=1268042 RepID=A0A7C9TR06_9MICO|nr:dihydrolipoamide acetyltransferase family protein [Galbitalea soli]NEM91836.1 2-oxo acid dehydrogenase subunit E2 [Galbitalea soli]NYJ29330.1 pyruvate dehydrogenase E2 component (dihydrolipoamide acetyltransferase) [Galbitalea soli]
MATILRMPEVLANATEAVVSAWTVAEGAAFSVGDTLAEVETEKALVDLPAEQSGILGRIIAQPGDTTAVGAPIAVLITEGETAADIDAVLGGSGGAAAATPAAPAPAPAPAAPAPAPAAAATAPEPETAPEPAPPAAPVPAEAVIQTAPATPAASGDRIFVSPIARVRARENGIDLATVTGTGPGGRIVRGDVEAAIASRASSPQPAAPQAAAPASAAPAAATPSSAAHPAAHEGGYTAIPHTGMRRAIARRLTESKSTVPHFYLTTDCRVDALLELRRQVNATSPVKISVNDFVVKAVAAAFADVPDANVTWTDTHLRKWDSVDIAVAVATDGGLLTPVVRGVDTLPLSGVSTRIVELAGRARAGRLRQEELEGGSFSVSNLGMYGTLEFSAILNPPQSGILAVGAAKPQPVVEDGEVVVRTVMRCTLSVDHRAVDGALAAQWLAAFTARIENPLSILI